MGERLSTIQPRSYPMPPSVPVDTSRAAAVSMRRAAGPLAQRVYRYIQEQGEHGATNEEIEYALGMSGNTVRPRVDDLKKAGRIVDSGARRRTRSGRQARVVRVAECADSADTKAT